MRTLWLASQQSILLYRGTIVSWQIPGLTSFKFCNFFSTLSLWEKPEHVQKACVLECELICLRAQVLTVQVSLTSSSKGQYIMELLPLMLRCKRCVQFSIPF